MVYQATIVDMIRQTMLEIGRMSNVMTWYADMEADKSVRESKSWEQN